MTTQSNPAIGQLPAYFGRKYQVVVNLPPPYEPIIVTDSEWEPEALRVTFDVYMPFYQGAYWYADIVIYNADSAIVDPILISKAQNISVELSAGYQNPQGAYDVIWSGNIFQAFLERENVVDLKLTLHCLIRLQPLLDPENVGDSFPAFSYADRHCRGDSQAYTNPRSRAVREHQACAIVALYPRIRQLRGRAYPHCRGQQHAMVAQFAGVKLRLRYRRPSVSDHPALVF